MFVHLNSFLSKKSISSTVTLSLVCFKWLCINSGFFSKFLKKDFNLDLSAFIEGITGLTSGVGSTPLY
jgi:hypothetical protein